MGRGGEEGFSSESRPRQAVLDLQALVQEHGAEQTDPGRAVAELMSTIRTLPVPVATGIGEPLQVYSHQSHYDRTQLSWIYQIVGEQSGENYAEIKIDLRGENVKNAPLEALGVGLRIALHHPEDLDDSVFEAESELMGSKPLLSCSFCGEKFVTYRSAVSHEELVHGEDTGDKRPRLADPVIE